jgi:hypothetical protein
MRSIKTANGKDHCAKCEIASENNEIHELDAEE